MGIRRMRTHRLFLALAYTQALHVPVSRIPEWQENLWHSHLPLMTLVEISFVHQLRWVVHRQTTCDGQGKTLHNASFGLNWAHNRHLKFHRLTYS